MYTVCGTTTGQQYLLYILTYTCNVWVTIMYMLCVVIRRLSVKMCYILVELYIKSCLATTVFLVSSVCSYMDTNTV